MRAQRGGEQRIRLRLDAGPDPLLAAALRTHADLIRNETLSLESAIEREPFASGSNEVFDLGDGRVLRVSLARL
jgi:hypothetical protein